MLWIEPPPGQGSLFGRGPLLLKWSPLLGADSLSMKETAVRFHSRSRHRDKAQSPLVSEGFAFRSYHPAIPGDYFIPLPVLSARA